MNSLIFKLTLKIWLPVAATPVTWRPGLRPPSGEGARPVRDAWPLCWDSKYISIAIHSSTYVSHATHQDISLGLLRFRTKSRVIPWEYLWILTYPLSTREHLKMVLLSQWVNEWMSQDLQKPIVQSEFWNTPLGGLLIKLHKWHDMSLNKSW